MKVLFYEAKDEFLIRVVACQTAEGNKYKIEGITLHQIDFLTPFGNQKRALQNPK